MAELIMPEVDDDFDDDVDEHLTGRNVFIKVYISDVNLKIKVKEINV